MATCLANLSCQLFAITEVHWVALKVVVVFFFYIFNAKHFLVWLVYLGYYIVLIVE